MDITADALLNQVSTIFLNKLDKQNIDPGILKGFMETLFKKYSFKDTGPIKQQSQTNTKEKPSSSTNSLVNDIKKVYKELLKDNSYISDYKQFLKKVSTAPLIKEKGLPSKKQTISQDITNNNVTNNTYNEQTKDASKLNLIKEETKPQVMLLGGITEQGYKSLRERLPNILKNLFNKQPPQEKPTTGGLGILGGGIALLLGGLAALVTGLMTDGPFKGILKILSKAGIQGGIKLLQIAAKVFISGLKQVIMAPINLLKSAAKSIGRIFGKGAYKAILKPLRGLTGLFTKMLGGLIKVLSPLLRRIPLVGTIISWGFAYSRFKSGDVVGGIIDVLSGIANIFAIIPGFGLIGSGIALGLDVLNAMLDVKAGGADKKASQKKTNILKGWALGLGKLLYKGIKYIPVIGPLIQSIEDMVNGKWLDATYNLVRAIPGVGIILDVLDYFTEGKSKETIKGGLSQAGEKIGEWMSWVRENIWTKITNFITGIFDGVKDWWNNLSWDPRSWVGMAPELPKESLQKDQPPTSSTASAKQDSTTTTQPVPLAKGGVVTQPVNAVVGEAGPEAVIPLEKYLNPKDLTLNNTTLKQIANNTDKTNSSLNGLTDAIIKMIGAFNQKMAPQNNTTIVNNSGNSKEPTSAAMAANFNVDPIRRVRTQFAV